MEKRAIAMLSLLLLGCFADPAQCRRMGDPGGVETQIDWSKEKCYHSVPISNPCLVLHLCWCCWLGPYCYSGKGDCERFCPPKMNYSIS
ncbi:unnamed protein product [Urochloa humidicola]